MIVAIDTETDLLGPGNVAPKLICCSLATEGQASLYAGHDPELPELLESLLLDEDVTIVGHNFAFDLTVFARAFPHLLPAIFDALEAGRITDTRIREKLLNLSSHGKLDVLELPDGSTQPIRYSLMTLVADYMGIDRSAQKSGDDIWRLNYNTLEGVETKDYPQEAADYAKQDATDTLAVYWAQAKRGEATTEFFQTAADFALRLITCWGIKIDQEEAARVRAMLDEELAPDKLNLLVESGILTPAQGPQPYKADLKKIPPGPMDVDALIAQGIRFKAATNEKVSKSRLQALVKKLCTEHGLELKLTDKGGISTDKSVLRVLKGLDEVVAQYAHRQSLQKIVTTYLKPLEGADTIHPDYDVLKETGRTSSYGSKLYPSVNIQQVDPRVRGCYVPRPGHVICSVDYEGLELASLAQTCYSLFGYSVHRDMINAGVNLHTYMGAQIAHRKDDGFRQYCQDSKANDPLSIYRTFSEFDGGTEEEQTFFDKWRKMAKPADLGLPGGMGTSTFVTYAAGYGVLLTEEEAQEIKDIWFETFPEMKDYFNFVNKRLKDQSNSSVDEDGNHVPLYAYTSPLGMYRAGATYCAAANGKALQTPSAEGAKIATFKVVRACYDWTQKSVLFGCRPLAFIHDEILGEIPEDEKMGDRANEVSKIMVDSMKKIMPDIDIRAEPALMHRWNKKAKTVINDDGELEVWE